MAPPNSVYLRNVSFPERRSVSLGERIAGGGAGDIHRMPDRPGEVLKVYKADKDRLLYAPKLEAMLSHKPTQSGGNLKFHQLAWPISIAETKAGAFLGFSMPEIDFDGSVSLERMLQKRMRQVTGLPEFYGYRLNAAHNLALCVASIHKRGHHIIDLKPVNCRLHAKDMLISILDCDGFSVDGGDAGRFPAHQFTPEYIAPEASGKNPESLGEAQDLFALAVIIFRLLNNGIHPFQSRLAKGLKSGTIQDMINANYYSYGLKSSKNYTPARQSVHAYFPDDFRQLFDQAFLSSSRPSAANWRDSLRGYADPSSGKLIRCDKNPDEHGHFGKGCGWCKLEDLNRSALPSTYRAKTSATPLDVHLPAGISPSLPLASLSKLRHSWALMITIVAAIFLLSVNFFETGKPSPPTQSQQSTQQPESRPSASKLSEVQKPKPPRLTTIDKPGFIVSNANLRSGPGAEFSIILTVPKGTQVGVHAKLDRGNWFLIEVTGQNGSTNTTSRGFVHEQLVAIFD